MEIRSSLPSASIPGRIPPITGSGVYAGAPTSKAVLEDTLVLSQFLTAGLLYKAQDARIGKQLSARPPLASEPRVTLARPFVMVPGWKTECERFRPLGAKLTEGGANGGRVYYVKNGEFFSDFETRQQAVGGTVPADARVFQVVLRDGHESPEVAADELDRNFEAIRQATGAARVDVDAYSMGGLGTRIYLDRGGSAVGRLMMLGTPNRGTRFAELAKHIIKRDIRWAMSIGGMASGDLPALTWMAVDGADSSRNPRLHELNARWPQQSAQLEAVEIVGGQGQVTPASDKRTLYEAGDGLVPVESLSLPGTPARIVPGGKHHGHLNEDASTYREMVRFFGWTPTSGPAAANPQP